MREIKVGIRMDPQEGISFWGIELVNSLLNFGAVVSTIEPGGAVMRKMGERDGHVQLAMAGCDLKIVLDDSAVDSSPQKLEHDRLYTAGCDLISPHMHLIDRNSMVADSAQAREELQQGIEYLRRAISMNPANWAAYWVVGKAHQALHDSPSACEAFQQAFRLEKGNADVAREYMFECLNLGEVKPAIQAARHAVSVKPNDAGLIANLALALLIGGQLQEAAQTVHEALAINSADPITRNLEEIIAQVRLGKRPQPSKLSDLN